MKKHYLFILSLILSIHAIAQTSFEQYYGNLSDDYSFEVKQTTDGGYISIGPTTSNGYDFYLIRTDANGDTSWTKTIGGTDEDWGYSVEQTTDGGFAVFGWTKSYGVGGFADFYLIKLDLSGNISWTKTLGSPGADYGYRIHQTDDGGYAMLGSQCNLGPCNFNTYFIKTDANGDTLWTKVYGGDQSEAGLDFVQTTDGGYAIGGYTASFGAGSNDFYLIKTNEYGDTLWTKTYGGTNTEKAESIRQTSDGGYILLGSTKSFGAGSDDFYLVKTDSNGDSIWTKTYGGQGSDKAISIQQTNDGGYILVGQTQSYAPVSSAVYLIKTNNQGDTLWTKVLTGKEVAYGKYVQQTIDGGYIIGGSTFNMMAFNNDALLIKLDPLLLPCQNSLSTIYASSCDNYLSPSGKYIWTNTGMFSDTIPNTNGCDSIISVNLTINNSFFDSLAINSCNSYTSPSGNIYTTTGEFEDTLISINGCDSILIINLNIFTIDTSISISGNTLLSNENNASYQWLDCFNSFIQIPNEINHSFTPAIAGNYAVIITKNGCNDTSSCYAVIPNGIKTQNSLNYIEISPNPSKNCFHVFLNNYYNVVTYQVIDLTGRVLNSNTLKNTNQFTLTIPEPKGVYLLSIAFDEKFITKKLSIE